MMPALVCHKATRSHLPNSPPLAAEGVARQRDRREPSCEDEIKGALA